MKTFGKAFIIFIIFNMIATSIYSSYNSIIAYIALIALFVFPVYYCYKLYKENYSEEDKNIPLKQVLKMLPISLLLFICHDTAESYVLSLLIKEVEQHFVRNFSFVLTVAIYNPIMEELMLRGILFNYLQRKYSFWISNLIQAFVFAVLHFNPILMIFFFISGLIYGILRRRPVFIAVLLYIC